MSMQACNVPSRVRLLWENFERASPKLVLGMPTKKSPKFFDSLRIHRIQAEH